MIKRKVLTTLSLASALVLHAQELQEHWWQAYAPTTEGGSVTHLARAEGSSTLYLAGSFDHLGPDVRYGAQMDVVTGYLDEGFNGLELPGHACAPDGAGGWYVGGAFTEVAGEPRAHLARLNADGSVHPWNPGLAVQPTSFVEVIKELGGKLFVGGLGIDGTTNEARNRLMAFDPATGELLEWDANIVGLAVYDLALSGDTLFIAGFFSSVGGQPRTHLAAVDVNTAEVLDWSPVLNQAVFSLDVSGSKVYIGGLFTLPLPLGVSTQFAAIDAITGAHIANDVPRINAIVNSVKVIGDTILVGGEFNSVIVTGAGSSPRAHFAAIDKNTGTPLPWAPDPDANVRQIHVHGASIYLAGDFSNIAGNVRHRMAELDLATGEVTDWATGAADGNVFQVARNGTKLFAAGNARSFGGRARNRLAAMDITTGRTTDWDPDCDWLIYEMILAGNTIYVGGQFDNIGGVPRARIAALDAVTGAVLPWDPGVTGVVRAIARKDDVVFIGGQFTAVAGEPRTNLAAIDANTGTVLPWAPTTNNPVFAIHLHEDDVYLGGTFTQVNGTTRNRLARVDANNGGLSAWDPNLNNQVFALSASDSTLYVSGSFTSVNPGTVATRNRLAAFDLSSGALTAWNPNASNTVQTIHYKDSVVLVGGDFTQIGGQFRGRGALVNINGTLEAWNANLNNNGIRAILGNASGIFAGGTFGLVNNQERRRLAVYSSLDCLGLDADIGDPCDPGPGFSNGVVTEACECVGDIITNVDGMVQANGLLVHPNPARDLLYIHMPDGGPARGILIIDALGRMHQPIVSQQEGPLAIDVSGLATGQYYLRVTDRAGRISGSRILIAR
jgi:nitrite reductase/ring-hydroxylating ferredoxin subunit